MMNKKLLFLISLCLNAAIFCTVSNATVSNAKDNANVLVKPLDQIIAVVNEDVITKTEFTRGITVIKLQLEQENMPEPPSKVLEKQVLDQLINKKLEQQLAKQAGIKITDEELENAIQSLAKQNQITVEMLYERINKEGMTTRDYRKELRDQMTMQKLQRQEVVSRIHITKEEVETFMKSKVWQKNGANEYHLEDILIPLSDAPSPEEIAKAKQHAEDVLKKLNNGQNFREVAQTESGSNNVLKGGDLGWRKLPEIPSAFVDKILHMQVKGLAGPIQTANGFHIIRLAATRRATTEQASPDRKQIETLLMQRKFEEALQNWISRLRSQAFIVTNPS
jgi:peptidyl-prolyl cis-trans isomerase SurA